MVRVFTFKPRPKISGKTKMLWAIFREKKKKKSDWNS